MSAPLKAALAFNCVIKPLHSAQVKLRPVRQRTIRRVEWLALRAIRAAQ
jgi:hypothetical protein